MISCSCCLTSSECLKGCFDQHFAIHLMFSWPAFHVYQHHISPTVQQRITVFPENAEIWIGPLFFTEKITKNNFTFLLNIVPSLFSLTFLLSYTFLNLFTNVSTSSLKVKNCATAEKRLWILTNTWNNRSVSKRNWNWFAGSENSVGWQCTSYSHFRLSCQIPSSWNLITRWWLGKHETNFSLIKEQVFCLLYVLSLWELWKNRVLGYWNVHLWNNLKGIREENRKKKKGLRK